MTNTESLFPPKSAAHPTIYAYSETRAELAGLLKVGYTDRAVEVRMAEHYPTKLPDGTMPYRVELVESAKRVLILTFKPAVESAWRDDLLHHRDFEGWQFVSNKNAADESLSIDAKYYLYLSGTPFRAINSGEFIEDQIFNRTYSDEQTVDARLGGQQASMRDGAA